MTDDDIRARAAELLERLQPTEEEIAEMEERRAANRVAAIMAQPAPQSSTVRKQRDDALAPRDRRPPSSREASLSMDLKHARGEPITDQDRANWWAARAVELVGDFRAGKQARAFADLIAETASHFISATRQRQTLERRISELERQLAALAPKPRRRKDSAA